MDPKEQEYFQQQGIICNKVIASGAFGVVYNVYSTQYKSSFALKRVPESMFNESELECLKAIDNPYIVSLYKTFRFNGNCYMLMEYCPNNLNNLIVPGTCMNPLDVLKYSYEMILSLKACHDKNIAHCDIKPTNFLLDKYGRIKISDFGLSGQFCHNQKCNVFQGTKLFMAPEIFNAANYNPMKADIWAIGVTFYLMATGQFPFYGQDLKSLSHKLEKGIYSNELVEDRLLANVIDSCLDIDPNQRPTVDQLLAMPYFIQDRDTIYDKNFNSSTNTPATTCSKSQLSPQIIFRPKVIKRNSRCTFFSPSPIGERLHLSRPLSRSVDRICKCDPK